MRFVDTNVLLYAVSTLPDEFKAQGADNHSRNREARAESSPEREGGEVLRDQTT